MHILRIISSLACVSPTTEMVNKLPDRLRNQLKKQPARNLKKYNESLALVAEQMKEEIPKK